MAGVLLLHDNAPMHRSQIAAAVIRTCGFEQLDHPPYSPDLAPSDYYLFANLKKELRGRRFLSDKEVTDYVTEWLHTRTSDFYHQGIQQLRERYIQCIAHKGEYIDREGTICVSQLSFWVILKIH